MSHEALLGAIVAQPDSDDARLVYADWLEEQDDPARATFIRDQCRLATLQETDPGWPSLYARTERLRHRHEAAWTAPLAETLADDPPTVCTFGFRRGLVEEVRLPAGHAERALPRLAPLAPLRRASLHYAPGADLSELLELHAALGLRGLSLLRALPDHVYTIKVRTLQRLRPEHLAHLDELRIDGARLSESGFERLAALLGSASIRSLSLVNSQSEEKRLAALSEAGALDRLESIEIEDYLGLEDLVPLFRRSDTAIRSLSLRRVKREGPIAQRALDWRPLSALSVRDVATAQLDRLCEHPRLPAVRRLSLDCNAVWFRYEMWDPTPLSKVPFEALTHLSLRQCGLVPAGTGALLSSPHLRSLVSLSLGWCGADDDTVRAITASRHLTRLTALDLSGHRLTLAGYEALAGWPGLANVTDLDLSGPESAAPDPRDVAGILAMSPYLDPVRLRVQSSMVGTLQAQFGTAVLA